MSAARLILKQPTGWFAAGREVAQALALLSDGAFKLYIHLCLEADRHTGRARIESAALTRILRKDAASIEAGLDELEHEGVCERQADQVEICDASGRMRNRSRWRPAFRRRSSCGKRGRLSWRRLVCVRCLRRQTKSWHAILAEAG